MTIPLQFVSLYDGQEIFVWSDCLLDLGTDFLVGTVDGQRQRVDVPAHARRAHSGLPQKRLEEDLR